ncbi:MAG: DNA-protecting protein DprA [Magnetococcales bacterium]|nr:DNA-protecting protein DprA [Magnetococcales bacterium]
MEPEARLEWLKLIRTPGLGPVRIHRLLRHFGTPQAVLDAPERDWEQVPGIQIPFLQKILRLRHEMPIVPIRQELNRLQAMGGQLLILGDAQYPPLLQEIYDPPPALFVLGDPSHLLQNNSVAVVGSRQASPFGGQFAYRLAMDLAQQGLVTVSGLAEGIDTAAHWGAVEGQGITIGVLATGLDVCYPARNGRLRDRVLRQGCLVTEAPLGTQPAAYLFPPRNRIISGLCRGVVVVEAAMRSGSLVTARLAMEQGREVFAVPAQVGDPRYQGSNHLLRQGATYLEGVADIIQAFSWDARPPTRNSLPRPVPPGRGHQPADLPVAVGTEAAAVHALLKQGPIQGDELARRCHLTVTALSRILLQLELVGVVQRLPGNQFALRYS